jgi:hypothetical protein
MLKGAQKRMYVVKLGQESPFEEAYFVLKRECEAVEGKDMVSEAARIIRQSAGQECVPTFPKKRIWQDVLIFAGGLITGGGIAAVICLLV